MSTVKMPGPVAYAHIAKDGFIRMWSKEKTNLKAVTESIGKEPIALITTDQAEAYKDTCVREALEEAAGLCDRFSNRMMSAEECADAIRAMIPK